MGALFGIHFLNHGGKLNQELIQKMSEALEHRGSVATREYCGDGMFMGVRYLNSESRDDKIAADSQKRIWVAMDGAVFCHKWKSFDGVGDAKAILELYLAFGDSFPEKIDGSYAIVIWDGRLKKMIFVRDRLGYKPLFYSISQKNVVFASEIKAVLSTGLCEKSVNLRALNNFLTYGYPVSPETLFKNISQVRPGHVVIFKDGTMKESAYWSFAYQMAFPEKSEKYYKDRFFDILETAVSRRVIKFPQADAFLSGGLDTSSLVAMMKKIKDNTFKVFTAGFKEKEYDETEDAKIVADHLNVEHHKILVCDTDMPSLIERIVWLQDSPFTDTSAIPTFYAAKLAKEHTDTVLTGDFPDQLIGGSGHHVRALSYQRNNSFLKWALNRPSINRIVVQIPMTATTTHLFDKIKRKIYLTTFPIEEQCIILRSVLKELLKRRLYSPEMNEINSQSDPLEIARAMYREVRNADLLDKLLYFDVKSYAPDDLMVKVERMTTGHGVAAYTPFHDADLVEFVARMPSHLKIRGDVTKYILKEAVGPMLPDYTLKKKKQGFAMPLDEWLMEGELPTYAKDILLDRNTLQRGYFDGKFLSRMVTNYFRGKTDYASGSSYAIIALLTLELWHRLFVDDKSGI